MSTRVEHDSLGEVAVPADALYGAQTQRAIDNFQLSGIRMPRALPATSAGVGMPDPSAPMGARQLAASRYWPACRGRAIGSREKAVIGSDSTGGS